MWFRLALGFASVAVLSTAAPAQTTYITLTTDNDWFANEDRHYTAGFQVSAVKKIDHLPDMVRRFDPLSWSADRWIALSVGQRVYTPGNINPLPQDPPDRPFAGWLYVQADIRTQTGPTVDHLVANVGYIGPAAGGRTLQSITHRIVGSGQSDGWGEQLRSEPTLLLGYDRSWPGLAAASVRGLTIDLSPFAGATAGNVYTYAHAGLIARLGRNLPGDISTQQISLGPQRDGFRGASGFGWQVWAGVEARAVARNVFLDGSTFHHSASVERKPFQADLQAGVVVEWPKTRIGFTLVRRTREFTEQLKPDTFGQLVVSFAY
ncbi:MAG: lipid A deacylase LpxR family protein [Casimicrobiaceae bacterium]